MTGVSYKGPTYNFTFSNRSFHDYEFAEYVKDVVCYNQGEFIQYSFLAAELHKHMKTAKAGTDLDLVRKCKEALVDYLNRNLERITKKNFEYLHYHFKRRAKNSPRICIKGGYDIDNSESVVSLFRDRNVNYDSNCSIEQNTGFKFIYDTGQPYICNDIPAKAMVGEYINPRLNIGAAKIYSTSWIKRLFSKGEDEAWEKCWYLNGKQCVTEDSCYKSTLIVPITLWNNSLDDKYKDLINLDDVDRTILGFLCIDHTNVDYFIPDIDVHLCYVFSDIMSLYLMSRMVYTEISDTFKSVTEQLIESN